VITRVIAINDWLYQGDCIMRISRFASALALSLGLTVMPTILVAESGPANTAANNLHTKRHAGHARCRYSGQRCSTGCGTFSDKGVCAEYVCDHRAWSFSGFCLKSVCARKAC
jgi:hypothetical protein